MAKYDVTMSCGHVQTVQLFGKMADRENKIAWLENHGVCNECQKAETERKRAEATAKAAEKAIADNFPDIAGTEKQVNWALTIRAKMLAEVDKKIADNKDRMDADKLATAELQAKAIKKVVANKFTTAKFWIDNRDSFLQKIIKDNNLAEEIKAEIANLQAAETENVTAEVIAEDDGSNDDPDEDEIAVTYKVDEEEEDDEDELVDPPIDTAEVKEEKEMKEIKVPEASTTTDTVKFEVGKIYYPDIRSLSVRIKITKRTAKTVHYKVEHYTGEFNCETRANIQIWDGIEHFYSGYTSARYYANDAAETAIETVETENVVNAEDSSTLKASKEELIYVNNQLKGVQRNIEYYVEQIKEYIGCIAKCENFISNYGVNLYDLQNKVAALENEVANHKLIDAIDDIGGSADAINASVAAMIELNSANFTAIFNDVANNFTAANLLNSANDFTAANLLDAVNAADKAVENVVKFEIQNFAADVNIADSYATIDTAVSGTVIPVIDEDAEIKNQLAEIADLANREKELEQQIAALQENLNAVHREYVKKDWKLTKYAKDLMDAVYQTVKTAFAKRTEWGSIEINGVMMQSWHWDEYNAVRTKFDDSGFALWFYDDTVPREYQYTEFVKYSTIKQFKAAISELAAAIERGDKTFTFPADEIADK